MKNLFTLDGKVALVTGGSRGIGKMIAHGFVENGVKTYITSRKAEDCEATAGELSKCGECITIPADLSSNEGIEHITKELKEREGKLDILVNNAGANWAAPFNEYPESGWDKVHTLNLRSVFFLTQSLHPLLKKSGSHQDPARVINIASIDALRAPILEIYAYSSSKAGLIELTKHMAKHLAKDNINVNALSPGPFESKMMEQTLKNFKDAILATIPTNRIGEPEDIAGACIYLASRAGAWITGINIPVDGGTIGCS